MSLRQTIRKAFNHDRWAIRFEYRDSSGAVTIRVVSPIRFVGSDRVLALCLCREEPRHFLLNRMRSVELVPANSVQMPEPITEVQAK